MSKYDNYSALRATPSLTSGNTPWALGVDIVTLKEHENITTRQVSTENKDVCRSRSNPALVSGIYDPERILHDPKNTESHATARCELSNSDIPAGTSNQVNIVEKERENASFRGLISTRVELKSLVVTEVRKLNRFALKNSMMQDCEKTLVQAIDMSFSAPDTVVKHVFFRFIKMKLTDMDQ